MLQRGRARAGAECCDGPLEARSRIDELQRGRARAGAECCACSNLHSDHHGLASTGPRPRGRGMCMVAARDNVAQYASTGPRPRGRGMQPPSQSIRRQHRWLQRGRARAGAEWQLALTTVRRRLGLQRGRARAGAE